MQVLGFTVLTPMTINVPLLEVEIGTKIPGVELLGPFPILQFFAALVVLFCVGIGGIVWIKGKASNEPMSAPKSPEAAIQLFFDGPLKAIFDYLVQIHSRQTQNRLEIRDEVAHLLSEVRQQIVDEIDKAKSELRGDINTSKQEINSKLDALNGLLNRIDGRMGR